MKFLPLVKCVLLTTLLCGVDIAIAQQPTKLYRLVRGDDNLYTADCTERISAQDPNNYAIDVGWDGAYVMPGSTSPPPDQAKPIYRAWNGAVHFLTDDKPEYDALVRAGWHPEGVGFYLSANADGGKPGFMRLVKQGTEAHLYLVNPAQIKPLVDSGQFKVEGGPMGFTWTSGARCPGPDLPRGANDRCQCVNKDSSAPVKSRILPLPKCTQSACEGQCGAAFPLAGAYANCLPGVP